MALLLWLAELLVGLLLVAWTVLFPLATLLSLGLTLPLLGLLAWRAAPLRARRNDPPAR